MNLSKLALVTALSGALCVSAQAGTLESWSTANAFSLRSGVQFGDLKVTAYSTTGVSGAGSKGALDGSSWLAAQLQGYSGSGFGVRNGCGALGVCSRRDTNEGSTPEHAVDNEQAVDIVVFELPTIPNVTWSFASLSVGYTSNDSSPEVNVWIGGGGLGQNYDFSNTCFINCTTPGESGLIQRGFTYAGRVDFNTNGNTHSNAKINAADSGSGLFDNRDASAVGQYIVIASSANAAKWDAFKISGLKANKIDVPPPPDTGQVPEPGSLMLLGSGVLGLAWLRRRRQSGSKS
jgi:hypothetical protein